MPLNTYFFHFLSTRAQGMYLEQLRGRSSREGNESRAQGSRRLAVGHEQLAKEPGAGRASAPWFRTALHDSLTAAVHFSKGSEAADWNIFLDKILSLFTTQIYRDEMATCLGEIASLNLHFQRGKKVFFGSNSQVM